MILDSQWFILGLVAITCWIGNRMFETYLEKRFDLEARIAHEQTLQKQVEVLQSIVLLYSNKSIEEVNHE